MCASCRIVECSFGRLKSKFKILHRNTSINDREKFPKLITTLFALHNYIYRAEGVAEDVDKEYDAWITDWRMCYMPDDTNGWGPGDVNDADGKYVQQALGKFLLANQHKHPEQILEECFAEW